VISLPYSIELLPYVFGGPSDIVTAGDATGGTLVDAACDTSSDGTGDTWSGTAGDWACDTLVDTADDTSVDGAGDTW